MFKNILKSKCLEICTLNFDYYLLFGACGL